MSKNLNANLVNGQIITILKKFMIFDNLSPTDIKKILRMDSKNSKVDKHYRSRIVKLYQYKAGETVIKEGEFDCWSFWVVKGSFDVIQNKEVIATFSSSGEKSGPSQKNKTLLIRPKRAGPEISRPF